MINLLAMLLGFVVVLALLFGGLCAVTGDGGKGGQIIVNCITVMVLFLLIVQLFNIGLPEDSIFATGLPLLQSVDRYGSVKEVLIQAPWVFALDFVELVALTLVINWVSNIFSFPNAGLWGKIVSRIAIVLLGILVYGIFMDFVKENIVIKWCVYCVECLITGGSILYTPVMIVASITGLKRDNAANSYILSEFPKTSIGRAISTAITSSVVFVAFLLVVESQYGSVAKVLDGTVEMFESWGAIAVMLMGIYFVANRVKSK